jgi:hypothetical protein
MCFKHFVHSIALPCHSLLLCCAVLCCAVLCCAVLCCAVLCCAVLCCAVLCCRELQCLSATDAQAVYKGQIRFSTDIIKSK